MSILFLGSLLVGIIVVIVAIAVVLAVAGGKNK